VRRTCKEFIAAVNRWSKAIQNSTITMVDTMVSYHGFPEEARPATHRKTEKERQIADGREGRLRGSRKSYDDEKAWSSINHSILSEEDVYYIKPIRQVQLADPTGKFLKQLF
jgi:hypothetical protein